MVATAPLHYRRHPLSLLGLVVALLMGGCGAPSPLAVRAVMPVNLNAEGESLPVRLRLYELKDRSRFMAAAFNDLWLDDRKALGPDRLADPRQVVVQPGRAGDEPRRYDLISVAEGTRFIGVMALYPRPGDEDERRAVIALDELGDQVIELSAYQLTVTDR